MAFRSRNFFIVAAAVLAACSGAAGGSVPANVTAQSAPAQRTLDQILDAAPPVVGRALIRKLSIHPNANAPAFLMNFLADGPNQAGVPCIDCVEGASTSDNVGMTGPYSYVAPNFVWQYTISFSDISYKGKCKLAYAIVSGTKKTIDSFSATLDLKTDGGFVLYSVARARPKYSGPATLTGKVTCGKASQSLQVPLQFG